ncbi:MAG: type II toxin-antitoxin system HicA family toxin [Magnetococcales bacterium]|nr:type II toxin-antitoxin system HicA family toxin [Magnetococcales bacterium]MBF0148894.1 type II toxin-antitoxin system HicA family toxin [Magnetococcales bacterium]MBF0172950.1 type II toxin-antitoxin system HicA family toxin [Magnetococcales bacterium]MBF0347342.1 type II toxin-antitoxin system HicA family toxin [Magnetococcales bacterium]MBF0630095.1 type II toxin-antitoxin system HicA family toxin [Magnetococcales bacterium]
MKRRDLIRHLERCGCELLREGNRHSLFIHRTGNKISTVPRHREINESLAIKICKDLDIPKPDSIR